jgi:Ala-tRNA(Pro) deacylase
VITPVLREFLDEADVEYEVTEHPQAFTAAEVAHAEDLDERDFAKSVIVMTDQGLAMVVLPASLRVDLERAQTELAMPAVRIADEGDFVDAFPGCEPGAEPPFGNLYDLPTFVDKTLRADQITFNAGSHTTTVTMRREDYLNLVDAALVNLATTRG